MQLKDKKPGRSRPRSIKPIDRVVSGVGRIAIRADRRGKTWRDRLNSAITRAKDAGQMEALRMLRDGQVRPDDFLASVEDGTVGRLRAAVALKPMIDLWIKDAGLRHSSEKRYRQSWDLMLRGPDAPRTTNELTRDWWDRVRARKGVSNSTRNRDRAAFLAFRSWATERGNPFPAFKPKRLKEEPRSCRILTPVEVTQVREASMREPRYLIFWALLDTGARQGELLNLEWQDLTADPWAIRIRSQEGSKARGRERTVTIDARIARALGAVPGSGKQGKVFPLDRHQFRHLWRQFCRDLGIEGVTPHGLRATYITRGLDANTPLVTVQKQVGHASATMTLRYYRNPAPDREAADDIRRALGLL